MATMEVWGPWRQQLLPCRLWLHPSGLGCTLVAWLHPCRHQPGPLWLGLRPCGLVGYVLVAWAAPTQTPGCVLVAVHGRSLGLQSCFLADSGCAPVAWATTLMTWSVPSQTPACALMTLAVPSWLDGLCPRGLGWALTDTGLCPCGLGCALVTWWAMPSWLGLRPRRRQTVPLWLCMADYLGCRAVSLQTLAAPSWLGLRPRGLFCTLADAGLRPRGLDCALVAWAAPSWLGGLCSCGLGCALVDTGL